MIVRQFCYLRFYLFTLLGISCLLGLALIGGSNALAANPKPDVIQTPRALETSEQDKLIVELKAQNELLKDYQQHLLETVYFSLGGLGVLVSLLLGYSWFTNFKIYERDKASLVNDLTAEVSKQIILKTTQINENISINQSAYDEKINKYFQELSEVSNKNIAKQADQIKSDVIKIKHGLLILEHTVVKAELDKWMASKVYINATRCALKLIDIGLEVGFDFYVSDGLDQLNKTVSLSNSLGADLVSEITSTLDKMPAAHAAMSAKIKSRLRI